MDKLLYYGFTIVLLTIATIISGCSKADYIGERSPNSFEIDSNDPNIVLDNEGNTTVIADAQTPNFTVKIVIPDNLYKSAPTDSKSCYLALTPTYARVGHAYSLGNFEPNDYKWEDIRQIGANEWETNTMKIKKIIDNDEVYFQFTLSPNTTNLYLVHDIGFAARKRASYAAHFYIFQGKNNNPKFHARYKKQTYISEMTEDENGNIVYTDKETQGLINRLDKMEHVETIVSNGMVYFFDSEDIEKNKGLKKLCANISEQLPGNENNSRLTRATGTGIFSGKTFDSSGYAIMFEDRNFAGSKIDNNLRTPYDIWEILDLKTDGLNDKISSIGVGYYFNVKDVTCVLTVWEDDNFNHGDNDRTKHRMSFVASYNSPEVTWSDLRGLPCLGSGNSWNDRISSISLHFGYYGVDLKNY